MSPNWKKKYKNLQKEERNSFEKFQKLKQIGLLLFTVGAAAAVFTTVHPFLTGFLSSSFAMLLCVPLTILLAIGYKKIVHSLMKILIEPSTYKKHEGELMHKGAKKDTNLLEEIYENIKNIKKSKTEKNIVLGDNEEKE